MMSYEKYKKCVQVVEYLSPGHSYGNSKIPFLFLETDEETGNLCHYDNNYVRFTILYKADYDSYEKFLDAVIDIGYQYYKEGRKMRNLNGQ